MDWWGVKAETPSWSWTKRQERIAVTTAKIREILVGFASVLGGTHIPLLSIPPWSQCCSPGLGDWWGPAGDGLYPALEYSRSNCLIEHGSRWLFCPPTLLFPSGFQYMNNKSYLKTTTITTPLPPKPHQEGIFSPQDRELDKWSNR